MEQLNYSGNRRNVRASTGSIDWNIDRSGRPPYDFHAKDATSDETDAGAERSGVGYAAQARAGQVERPFRNEIITFLPDSVSAQ
jgi:hypothetical protein